MFAEQDIGHKQSYQKNFYLKHTCMYVCMYVLIPKTLLQKDVLFCTIKTITFYVNGKPIPLRSMLYKKQQKNHTVYEMFDMVQ